MNSNDLLQVINHQEDVQALGLHLTSQQCAISIHTMTPPVLQVSILWHFAGQSLWEAVRVALHAYGESQGFRDCQFHFDCVIHQHQTQHGLAARRGIKNIIAIASGKGGVGKSTVACNLALALLSQGAKVGLLDADIYGPSIPHMLGQADLPESKDSKTLEPLERYGLQVMSIGYLIDTDTAMIWRGPMVSTALQQLFNDTQWHDLDYLLIDLPPGTGDIQLTLAQKIPVAGALIVTTPQDIALLDAKRAVAMFNKVQVPVLGLIENMSYHQCTQCGYQEPIFGAGGGAAMAQACAIPLLAQIPLKRSIQEQLDRGCPTVAADPLDPISVLYQQLAIKVSVQLAQANLSLKSRFPKIVIE